MQQRIADYFKTQPVLKAWIFGSFARGEETPLSDVDILVVLDWDTKGSGTYVSYEWCSLVPEHLIISFSVFYFINFMDD